MSYLTTKQNQEKAFKTTLEYNLFSKDKSNEFQKEYGSSFFILNVNKLRENYKKIDTAFKSRYENFIIGYS